MEAFQPVYNDVLIKTKTPGKSEWNTTITRIINCPLTLIIKQELLTHLLKPLMTEDAGGSREHVRKSRIKHVSQSKESVQENCLNKDVMIHRPFSSVRVSSCSLKFTMSMRRRSSQCAPCRRVPQWTRMSRRHMKVIPNQVIGNLITWLQSKVTIMSL